MREKEKEDDTKISTLSQRDRNCLGRNDNPTMIIGNRSMVVDSQWRRSSSSHTDIEQLHDTPFEERCSRKNDCFSQNAHSSSSKHLTLKSFIISKVSAIATNSFWLLYRSWAHVTSLLMWLKSEMVITGHASIRAWNAGSYWSWKTSYSSTSSGRRQDYLEQIA